MIGKPGPFQIIENEGSGVVDSPMAAPRRRYECPNYQCCLDIAAALNWDNFTCRGCNGEVNEPLAWRAHQARRKDVLVDSICSLPPISLHAVGDAEDTKPRLVALKR